MTDPKLSERCAFLLVDHGSRRAEANALVEEVVQIVRNRVGPDEIVESAHMEIASPTVAEGFTRCVEQGATIIVAHPFMLAPGRHAREDLPRLIAAAAATHPGTAYVIAPPLGAHPGVADAVVDRCVTALAESTRERS